MSNIRRVLPSEIDRLLNCLTTAFIADIWARFLWPDASRFLYYFPKYIEISAKTTINNGTAWVIDDFAGVSIWCAPGQEPDWKAMGEFVANSRPSEERLADVTEAHISEPHWYLWLIAVDPIHQGHGLGGKLMEHAMTIVDHSGLPSYLEASPRSTALYSRYGYQALESVELGGQHLFTPMLRTAKTKR